jgi:hypothetical protein
MNGAGFIVVIGISIFAIAMLINAIGNLSDKDSDKAGNVIMIILCLIWLLGMTYNIF